MKLIKRLLNSSFIKGMGTIFNLAGDYTISNFSRKNRYLTPQEQDALAINRDWETVGNDMRKAIDSYKKYLNKK